MANKYQLKATALPWANAIKKNEYFTEQLSNALTASLSSLQQLQSDAAGERLALCVNASLSTLRGLLQQLDEQD